MTNQSTAMALLTTLSLVLLLATGVQADADELSSTSQRAAPEPSLVAKGYEISRGRLEATDGDHHREIKTGPCFPTKCDNAFSDNKGNAPTCIQRCTSKGYAGGHCDTVSGGFPGDCFCFT